ncbi:hypothetical protein BDV12DRAFT_193264 [Aspergillus spectabilis]
MPQTSYWRVWPVLARVLGCLPGVVSSNGWIGPCPAVDFITPVDDKSVDILGKPHEDEQTNEAELTDPNRWIIPEPPMPSTNGGTCRVQALATGKVSESEVEGRLEYRSRIVLQLDNRDPDTYTLHQNPVFVTHPPCDPGPKRSHEVHVRKRSNYQKLWETEKLRSNYLEDDGQTVMVIIATGEGNEVLARAWCAQQGRNASKGGRAVFSVHLSGSK